MPQKMNLYVICVTLVATLGGLLFGYDTAVISGTVASLDVVFIQPKGLPEISANSLLGFTVASALIGCIIGGFCGGYLSSRYGRKNALIIAAILFLISAIGSAYPELGLKDVEDSESIPYYLSNFITEFVTYRIIGGIGVGIASMVSPMYIAEIAPANVRGKMVSFNQFAIIAGQLLVYFVNYFIALSGDNTWLNTIGWRYMFLSETVPATLFLVLLLFVPESPRWLVLKNKLQQAEAVLKRLLGAESGQLELQNIKSSLAQRSTVKAPLFAFGVGVIVIGIMLSVFQQFVGINVALYYAPEVFKSLGASTETALLQTIIMGAINLSFTTIAIFTVDKYGRKPLQILGALGMAIGMFILGTAFYARLSGTIALTGMLFYIAAFAISWGPVCWVLLAEIFPNAIRSQALAIAVAAQWIANYLVSWTFPMMDKSSYLLEHFNHGFAYWVYGIMSVLAALFVWKFVPETKGKSLEELELLWKKK
ncbi:D-xylose transporter XylE [Mannheimia sp. AT1]|uniref:D-xylose transporter XylE n=1 Tax=Mannheimia cairinae TaxID=3025936 RepID=A0ABT5MQ77_9PAST|nr:D-xylose transporter XylE [Mannheimia cairinae]MDD0824325.1 D-xylose transporter XylE [Mannheimia cairinae]MDD0826552.1 D-xylose transporter XylE [Mannheimia cairinae]